LLLFLKSAACGTTLNKPAKIPAMGSHLNANNLLKTIGISCENKAAKTARIFIQL
jgi:hypothetical protein